MKKHSFIENPEGSHLPAGISVLAECWICHKSVEEHDLITDPTCLKISRVLREQNLTLVETGAK